VGPERLRVIMSALLDCSAKVVNRYGGTLDKFTGDGIMAVFGAPEALEDHALRACLAALDLQREAERLAAEVGRSDGVELKLRIGLNSGQVIAGEIGSTAGSYTTIGEQVGMAQRMESVASPGAVMVSESTARLVQNAVVLAKPEVVRVKGITASIPARRLVGVGASAVNRHGELPLVGRRWELNTVTGIFEEAMKGAGSVLSIVGPAGIGKSRIVRETATIAADRNVPMFTTYCESHTSDIPFHAVSRLLRISMGIDHLDAASGRIEVHARFPYAGAEDLTLLDDLLGIREAAAPLPEIAPDARRRRLVTLINSASLTRAEPAVYVIEDAHWIDEASEALLSDFFAVMQQTPSLVLVTYRPEYRGVLSQISWAQTVALRALSGEYTSTLTAALLGPDPALADLAAKISERASGNPFFAEEMVRDLAERGVLQGTTGGYLLCGEVSDVDVPATVQAAIAARIDRLQPAAKRTLQGAAVIGERFVADLLAGIIGDLDLVSLIEAELVDQVRFTPYSEYAFRHPLIRAVAYESQLNADRAQLHRSLAAAIEAGGSPEGNAALIAEHLEIAGDLHAAFGWHMRAGTWWTFRDIAAAQRSWRRARQVADRLPVEDADRAPMRIGPRAQLAGLAWRIDGGLFDPGFDELRELCDAAADQRSLAIGMAGLVTVKLMTGERRQAARSASELLELLDSIGDPTLGAALSLSVMAVKQEMAEMAEALILAQRFIDLAGGNPILGDLVFESPLALTIAMRGVARSSLGIPGWKDDFRKAVATPGADDPMTLGSVLWYAQITPMTNGIVLRDEDISRAGAELLAMAEQSGDDYSLDMARTTRGADLLHQDAAARATGLDLLNTVREKIRSQKFSTLALPVIEIHIASEKVKLGNFDIAVETARSHVEHLFSSGGSIWVAAASGALVEALLQRGGARDLDEARVAIDRLAAVQTQAGYVLNEIWLLRLRALLSRAVGDGRGYSGHRDCYRAMARRLGFEGHMAMAEAML
jgi:adenylate cyclase